MTDNLWLKFLDITPDRDVVWTKNSIELYAAAFESANALDKLEAFASFYGADFDRLPRNTEQITLTKTTWRVPDEIPFPESGLVPLQAGQEMTWLMT